MRAVVLSSVPADNLLALFENLTHVRIVKFALRAARGRSP
jgi:hypothetical protein